MPNYWQEAYCELKDFVAKNPQIEISKNSTVICGDTRTEFFRLFDAVRAAFVKERHQSLLDEAEILVRNYDEAAHKVTRALGLSQIQLFPRPNWSLGEPSGGLIRPLFDRLFDLLKGNTDIQGFERAANEAVRNSYGQLLRVGYRKWTILTLVSLSAPDKALTIPTAELEFRCPTLEVDERKGVYDTEVPLPTEASWMSLERKLDPSFVFPDVIVYSTRLKRYFSLTDELTNAVWSASYISTNRQWHQIREIGREYQPIFNWPDIVLYVDDHPEDIGLVADFAHFCQPDIMLECMEQENWWNNGGLERTIRDHDLLKPRLATYVTSRCPLPDEALKTLESETEGRNISVLNVGYDACKLEPIIQALLP